MPDYIDNWDTTHHQVYPILFNCRMFLFSWMFSTHKSVYDTQTPYFFDIFPIYKNAVVITDVSLCNAFTPVSDPGISGTGSRIGHLCCPTLLPQSYSHTTTLCSTHHFLRKWFVPFQASHISPKASRPPLHWLNRNQSDVIFLKDSRLRRCCGSLGTDTGQFSRHSSVSFFA